MIKSNIVAILSSLDRKKLRSFRQFLNSPYHNSNSNAVKLFNILEKYHPHYDRNELTRELIFEKIYKGPYKEWKVRNLLSDLMILAEEFLAVDKLKGKELHKIYFINEQYLKLKLYDIFKKSYNAVKKQLREQTIRDTEYYYFNWLFEDQALDARIRMDHEYANYSGLVHTTAEELIKFVLYQSMEFFQITYVANQSAEKTTEKSYVKFLLKYIEEQYNNLDPQLKAFYYLTSFSTNENKEHFLELQNLFSDSENRFDYNQQRNFYIALYSFCTSNININNYEYIAQLKKYNEIITERGYQNDQAGFLSEIVYRNTAVLAKFTGDLKWAYDYMEKFKYRLKPEVRESNYNFSLATLSFYEKKYGKALEFLTIVKCDDFYFKFQLASLLLKIHYELGNIESSYSLVDSHSHFIANNPNIPDSIREYFKNFLIYYRKLLTLKLNQNPGELKKIIEMISEINSIISKEWLLEKLKELENA